MARKAQRSVPVPGFNAAESTVVTLPAPTGGWNARDGLAAMGPTDAVLLQNWFPFTTYVGVRYGFSSFATGLPGPVESLMVYNGPSTSSMFGASVNGIYDVSTTGAVGAAKVSGLTNARWQHINVATTGGQYLLAVNGANKSVIYDGTAWHRDGDGAPYDITGVNSANCIQLNLHKNRVWLIQANTLDAWYLPTSAIGGAATKFSLNGVAMLGSYLRAMATWTMDAGYGMDDMAAFITNKGEIIVYSGTDPASSATWQLIGVYRIGSPVGTRCFLKYAGDLLLITQDGVQPMSAALQSSRTNPRVSITDKIQNAVSSAISSYGANFGWELCYFPGANQLYLNVPMNTGANQQQYVMNTITGAWCNFSGWSANCFAIYNDLLYFGANGSVMRGWNQYDDNGTTIDAPAIQAFNTFGDVDQRKHVTMIRPNFMTNASPSVFGGVNFDYDTGDTTATLIAISPAGSFTWDGTTSLWDTAQWGPDVVPVIVWQGAQGTGYAVAPHIRAQQSSGQTLQWASTDVVFRRGGIL